MCEALIREKRFHSQRKKSSAEKIDKLRKKLFFKRRFFRFAYDWCFYSYRFVHEHFFIEMSIFDWRGELGRFSDWTASEFQLQSNDEQRFEPSYWIAQFSRLFVILSQQLLISKFSIPMNSELVYIVSNLHEHSKP